MGRDYFSHTQGAAAGVSIHAPAWGATFTLSNTLLGAYVSIHAPAWGATVYLQLIAYKELFCCFVRIRYFSP